MGRVKDYFWDEIEARAASEPDHPEPDDLEMLRADAELAWGRYLNALAAEGRQSEGEHHERRC